MHMLHIMKGMQ